MKQTSLSTPNYKGQCVVQARQQQMQLKAKRREAEEQQDSDFSNSLSAREAHLSKLEQAHQAAVKAHIINIKYVCAFLVVACIAQLIAVCALTFATTCCQNAQFAPPQHVQSCIGSPHKYFGSRHYRAQNIANHSSRQFRIASRLQFTM